MEYIGTTLEGAHQYNSQDPSHAAKISVRCTDDEFDTIQRQGLNWFRNQLRGLMSLATGGTRDEDVDGYTVVVFIMNGTGLSKSDRPEAVHEFGKEMFEKIQALLGLL